MDQIKVGVIGVGHLGQHHARIYSGLPNTRVIGVVDLDKTRAQLIAKRYQVPFCESLAALLTEVDAVSVAVPTSSHYPIVKACLEAGCHVLVEKPISSTIEDGSELVRISKEKSLMLQVGHIERFNPVMEVASPFIRRPGFIECHRLGPFQPRGTDVDVVLDLMIHDLDMVLSFDLGEIQNVEAVGMRVFTKNIDIANARIEFGGGCVANLTASRVSSGRLRKLRVFQPDCYLSVDYQAREALVHQSMPDSKKKFELRPLHLRGTDEEPLYRELVSFVNAVMTKTPCPATGEEGVASLRLAHGVLDSIRGRESHQRRFDPESIPS